MRRRSVKAAPMPIPAFAPALRPALAEPWPAEADAEVDAAVDAKVDTEGDNDKDVAPLGLEVGGVVAPSVVVAGTTVPGTTPPGNIDASFASHSTIYGTCRAVPDGITVFSTSDPVGLKLNTKAVIGVEKDFAHEPNVFTVYPLLLVSMLVSCLHKVRCVPLATICTRNRFKASNSCTAGHVGMDKDGYARRDDMHATRAYSRTKPLITHVIPSRVT
jgi:hypothetical protein